jgi:hypothetical protein
MKKSKSLFGRLNNEVRRNSADKATAFHRSSLREKALPQNACRPNNSVNLCKSVKSVVNFPSCLGVLVAETQLVRHSLGEGGSIKNNKLCETNPISEKPKMNLTNYTTKNYGNNLRLPTPEKQTQSNPILSAAGGKLAGKEFEFFDAQGVP